MVSFASQVVLNKDPTVWLDGDGPAKTCIPPFFLVNAPVQPWGIPTPTIHLQVLKNKLWKLPNCTSAWYTIWQQYYVAMEGYPIVLYGKSFSEIIVHIKKVV
jgi:hypothetical protein